MSAEDGATAYWIDHEGRYRVDRISAGQLRKGMTYQAAALIVLDWPEHTEVHRADEGQSWAHEAIDRIKSLAGKRPT